MAPSPKGVNYVKVGELWEVLEEQLEYLLLHKSTCGKDGYSCTDCWRLDRVKEVLVMPFVTKQFHMKRKKKSA